MQDKWYRHIKDHDEQKRFRSYIYNSRGVLDRLMDISKDMDKATENKEVNPETYDCPTWAAKQAHFNGYRQCLREFQKLLTLDQKDKE